ncbi:MAG: DUF488 domain-containing protein [Thermoleophilia bacterium]
MPDPAVTAARVYDAPGPGPALRVLVDRLWPRGLRREGAPFDVWCREVAPSNELRRWYGHRPEVRDEFAERYREELGEPERAAALDRLREAAQRRPLVLLTATRDVDDSHAAVLADVLGAG